MPRDLLADVIQLARRRNRTKSYVHVTDYKFSEQSRVNVQRSLVLATPRTLSCNLTKRERERERELSHCARTHFPRHFRRGVRKMTAA